MAENTYDMQPDCRDCLYTPQAIRLVAESQADFCEAVAQHGLKAVLGSSIDKERRIHENRLLGILAADAECEGRVEGVCGRK